MYLSLIVTFVLVLILAISGVQNSLSVDLKLIAWKLQMSLTALIFYSSLLGGAIIAVLTLPKLVSKSLKVRQLNKQIYELKKKALEVETAQEEGS